MACYLFGCQTINSLAPGRPRCHFKTAIFNLVLLIGIFTLSKDNSLRWMPRDLTDDKSTLVQVMAWCRQAPSHYLSQCWPSSMSPYGVTRPQCVNRTSDASLSVWPSGTGLLHCNCNQNIQLFLQENAFENVICKSILPYSKLLMHWPSVVTVLVHQWFNFHWFGQIHVVGGFLFSFATRIPGITCCVYDQEIMWTSYELWSIWQQDIAFLVLL